MNENKYEQRVRQRAEEMGRAAKPKLYDHILARYSAITLEGFIQEFIPAARLSVQREAEAYTSGYSVGRDMENDPYSRAGLKTMLQSLGLVPEIIVDEFSNEKNPSKMSFVALIKLYTEQQIAALREELEAVKKERDTLQVSGLSWHDQYHNKVNDLATCINQRDEAVKLLERYIQGNRYGVLEFGVLDFLNKETSLFLSRLSSGETKPAGPWISVEDRLPEDNQEVIAFRDFTKYGRKGSIDQGRFYIAHKNQRHGGPSSLVPAGLILEGSHYWAFPCIEPPEIVTYWMPIPAPPRIFNR